MLIDLTQAERSRMHVALMDAFDLKPNMPITPEVSALFALVEATAFYTDKKDPNLSTILDAAHAARTEVEICGRSLKSPIEFDIPSLKLATSFRCREAELVARLCGMRKYENGNRLVWKNTEDDAPLFEFPIDLMIPA